MKNKYVVDAFSKLRNSQETEKEREGTQKEHNSAQSTLRMNS